MSGHVVSHCMSCLLEHTPLRILLIPATSARPSRYTHDEVCTQDITAYNDVEDSQGDSVSLELSEYRAKHHSVLVAVMMYTLLPTLLSPCSS